MCDNGFVITRTDCEIDMIPASMCDAEEEVTSPMGSAATVAAGFESSGISVIGEQHSAAKTKKILRLFENDGEYFVERPQPQCEDSSSDSSGTGSRKVSKLWEVIRHSKGSGRPLVEGDVLKLGRFKIKVKEIVTTPEEARERENEAERSGRDFSEDRASALTVSTEFKDVDDDSEEALPLSEKVCRICYEPGEKENPLVAPCSGWTDDCASGKTLVEALEVDDRADRSRTATFGAVSIQQQSSAEVPRKGLHIMSLGGNPRSVIRVGRGHDADSGRRRSTGKSLLYVVIIAGNFVGERWAYGRSKRAFEREERGGKNGSEEEGDDDVGGPVQPQAVVDCGEERPAGITREGTAAAVERMLSLGIPELS
ncbi:hypothetical protein Pmar_PMAR001781 [Perkinsus marinus ATCC 50983]|uniref:FHA domain-containing protein n=1 Tax=Perkinsus marinus (strain ATCC 50983 / TXsc) TaxID=423536 RepID=C5LJM1_PERM5|nr:hypothetical protein Pmar_PMAR001781 [Perkinsus marinus ATCC 50983]EER03038.1 hypothetical protein Pmar_PMAR001781 [Perkinsus marinus ATCC 50983]|eukprot:XP_002771222.1 hypothetical protein Pmar_PMAR001781 [Perkinsus marinus ATCC 50983]